MNLLNNMILGFGLEGAYEWVKAQGAILLGIIIIGLVIYCVLKRAWGFMVTLVIVGSLAFFLVMKPESLINVGQFIGNLLGIG
ncbi:TPA: hypothetical protein QCU33_005380 [Bacillus cereus]|nr:hypothetical protein [Bacillus cereus]